MPTHTRSRDDHVETYQCSAADCDEEFHAGRAIEGSYCSQACADRDCGQTVLDHLRQDHRFCSTCLRPRKVVYRPADSETPALRRKALIVREAFIGFEDLTQWSDMGPHGIECQCGSLDHHTPDDWLRSGEPWEWWLARAVDQLRREGQWEYCLDAANLAEETWDGGDQDVDLALALGRALD